MQSYSLQETARRFFAPYTKNRALSNLRIFESVENALFACGSIWMVREITLRIAAGNTASVVTIAWVFAGVAAGHWIFSYAVRHVGWPKVEMETLKIISTDYLERFIRSDNTKTEKIGTGHLLTLFSEGVKTWANMYEIFLYEAPRYLITLVFSVVFVTLTNAVFGFAYFASLIVIIAGVVFFDRRVIEGRKVRSVIKLRWSRAITRSIMSKLEIMMAGKTSAEVRRSNWLIDEWADTNRTINEAVWRMFFLPQALVVLARTTLYFLIGYELIGSGNLLAALPIFTLLAYLESMTSSFVTWYKEIGASFPDIEKLWSTFDDLEQKSRKTAQTPFEFAHGEISFQNVDFSYEGGKSVLRGLSFRIPGGRRIALVGPSGGGKTTVMKLIAGYMHADAGKVTVDGQDIADVSLTSYFRHIGYLTQDPMVFDGSIRDNLTYWRSEEVSDEDIFRALEHAQCAFVSQMANSIETEIGERGVRLSGGQKQRLAIAKIFLKNPEIILLDEPTAALDSFSEEAITKALDALFVGRTVVIIAHRLQTVRHADDILYIEDGAVVEQGNHETLVAKNGKYAKMLEIQTGF